MGKILTFGNEARQSILNGMVKLESAVASTLGPKGHTVIIDNGTIHPVVTKDGVTVARAVEFKNRYENLGANLVKEAARKTEKTAGDGTTTSTVLLTALCKAGNDLVNLNFDANDIKKGFEKAKNDILTRLKETSRDCRDGTDIFKIATISSNNDEEIGGYIREAYETIGDNGRVRANAAYNRNGKTTITYSNGLEMHRGFFTSKVINTTHESCEFDNPQYFVYGKMLRDIKDINAIFQLVKKPLVIVAPAYSDDFITQFIEYLDSKEAIPVVCIGPDGTSKEAMDDGIEDIAVMVGATVLEGRQNIKLDDFKMPYFGGSASIVVTKNKTTITDGNGTDEQLLAHIEKLEKSMTEEIEGAPIKSLYEIDFIRDRIAKLDGGIATIHFGGFSDVEIKEKRDRYEDALKAVDSALQEGIIIGGGSGLLHAIKYVADNHITLENSTQEKGYQEFLKVMETPARKIIESTGKDPGYYSEKIKESKNELYGYNAKTEKFSEDLFADGVVDPYSVIRNALSYGTSIAGTFIASNCVIIPDSDNYGVMPNDELMDEERD